MRALASNSLPYGLPASRRSIICRFWLRSYNCVSALMAFLGHDRERDFRSAHFSGAVSYLIRRSLKELRIMYDVLAPPTGPKRAMKSITSVTCEFNCRPHSVERPTRVAFTDASSKIFTLIGSPRFASERVQKFHVDISCIFTIVQNTNYLENLY